MRAKIPLFFNKQVFTHSFCMLGRSLKIVIFNKRHINIYENALRFEIKWYICKREIYK